MSINRNPEIKSENTDEERIQNIKQYLQVPLTIENVSKVFDCVQQIENSALLPEVFDEIINSAKSLAKSAESFHKNYVMHTVLIYSIYKKSGYNNSFAKHFDLFDTVHAQELESFKKGISQEDRYALRSCIDYFNKITNNALKISNESCRAAIQEMLTKQFKNQLKVILGSHDLRSAIYEISASRNDFLKQIFIKFLIEDVSYANLSRNTVEGLLDECWAMKIYISGDERIKLWSNAWRSSLTHEIEKYINAGHRDINVARAELLLRELKDPSVRIGDLKLHILNIFSSKENKKLQDLLNTSLNQWRNMTISGYDHHNLRHELENVYKLNLSPLLIDEERIYIKKSELAEKEKRINEWKKLACLVFEKIEQKHLKYVIFGKSTSATELKSRIEHASNYEELYKAINAAIEKVSDTHLSLALHQIKYSLTNFKDVSDADLNALDTTLKNISPNISIKGEYYLNEKLKPEVLFQELSELEERYQSWQGTLYFEDSTDVLDNKFFKPLQYIETKLESLSKLKYSNELYKLKMELDEVKASMALNTLDQSFKEIQKTAKEKEEKNWKEFAEKERVIMSSAEKTKESLDLIRDKYYHILDDKEKKLFEQARTYVSNVQDERKFVTALVGLGIDKILSTLQKIVSSVTKLEDGLKYWESHINKLRDVISERMNDPNLSDVARTTLLAEQTKLNRIYLSREERHNEILKLKSENNNKQQSIAKNTVEVAQVQPVETRQTINTQTQNIDTSIYENIPKIIIPASTKDKLKYLKEIYQSWDSRLYWEGSHNPVDFKDHKTLMSIERVLKDSEAILKNVKSDADMKSIEIGRRLEEVLKSKDFIDLYKRDETDKLKEKLKIEKSTEEFNQSENNFNNLHTKTRDTYDKIKDNLTPSEKKMCEETIKMLDTLSNPDSNLESIIKDGNYDKLYETAKGPCEQVIALEQDVAIWQHAINDIIDKITQLKVKEPSDEVKVQMEEWVSDLHGMLKSDDERNYNALVPFAECIDQMKNNFDNSPAVNTSTHKTAPLMLLFPSVPKHDPLPAVENTQKVLSAESPKKMLKG